MTCTSARMTSHQYLSERELSSELGDSQVTHINLISQDSYDDREVLKSVKKTGMTGELLACTIQIALVGFGNKSFGKVSYKGHELDVKSIFDKCHVSYKHVLNSKLQPGDLTPRRLIRLFRYQVQSFIQKTGKQSYLAKKYYKGDEKNMFVIFPGAESVVTNEGDAKELLKAYSELDKRLGTSISERIKRVLTARSVTF